MGDVRSERSTGAHNSFGARPLRLVDEPSYPSIGHDDRHMAFTRIKVDHRIMAGLPCIAGTRLPVAMLVRVVAAGTSMEAIVAAYPQLTEDDVREALRFAAANIDQRVVPLDQTA